MKWDELRGHSKHVEWFRHAIARGRLTHAYVLAGPDGIGKRLFARMLAQCLFCQRHTNAELLACGECSSCKQVAAGSHPDLHEVGRKSGKSEFTIDVMLGPEENRGREGLCYDLSRLPMSADRKIAILDDATAMNDATANAFLKTLEEPQPRSLLLLIADNLDALLPTIRSRCQTIRFDPLSEADIAALLLQLEWVKERSEADTLAALSNGSLAVAAQLLDPQLRELRDAMYSQLAGNDFQPLALSEKLAAGLESIGGDSATTRRNAGWLIRFGLEFFRSAALLLSDQAQVAVIPAAATFTRRFGQRSAEDLEFVMSLFDRVAETERHIDTNIAVPRCLEVLCDDLGRLLHAKR